MDTILDLLKIDLGILHDKRDPYFIKLLQGTIKELERRGIKPDLNSTDDQMLVADYAAWVYRKRSEDAPLAQNIQIRIRNRIIAERIAKQNAIIPEV
jgi:hypothetical protein